MKYFHFNNINNSEIISSLELISENKAKEIADTHNITDLNIKGVVYYEYTENTIKRFVIAITLEEAKKWYNGRNKTLKELALKAYKAEELQKETYTKILRTLYDKGEVKNMPIKIPESQIAREYLLSQLKLLAYYYNKGWQPKDGEAKYYFNGISNGKAEIGLSHGHPNIEITYFKTERSLMKALKLLNKEKLITAFSK